jgi:hypothetical protein
MKRTLVRQNIIYLIMKQSSIKMKLSSLKRSYILAMVVLFFGNLIQAQPISLPKNPSTSTTPKQQSALPVKTVKAPPAPSKVYKQASVRVNVNISTRILLNVEADGTTLKNEFIVNASDVGNYIYQTIYTGDATLELRLANGKSYRYNEFLSIDPDISTMDISLSSSGNIEVVTKTNADIKREMLLKRQEEANRLVSILSESVASISFREVVVVDFQSALKQMTSKDLIDRKTQMLGDNLINSLRLLQTAFFELTKQKDKIDFYRSNSNFQWIQSVREKQNIAKSNFEQMQSNWGNYAYSTLFLTRIGTYLVAIDQELVVLPSNTQVFSKKVTETNANWERIKAEEERRRSEELERIERERQVRIRKEQEEAEARERVRRLREYEYNQWDQKSGYFLTGSLPIGLELSLLASDRIGNAFGCRYFKGSSSNTKLHVYNSLILPLSGAFQGGITFGFGAVQTDQIDPKVKDAFIWDYGMSLGGRLMYVDYNWMLGLEYNYGGEVASGTFFLLGYKLSSLSN